MRELYRFLRSGDGVKALIYILEDDESIRELVTYTLGSQGLEAEGFARPSEFWEAMAKRTPALVLLDIMLPEEDGIHILKRLRSSPATKRLPVIMLTAKGSEYDTVRGLDSGADDYIPKPFRMMELLSRHPCAAAPDAGGKGNKGIQRRYALRLSVPPHGDGGRQAGRADPEGI